MQLSLLELISERHTGYIGLHIIGTTVIIGSRFSDLFTVGFIRSFLI